MRKLSVADIHAIWGVRWGLYAMDANPPGLGASKEKGLGKDEFPKVWKLIESLPESAGKTVSSEEGLKTVEGSLLTARNEGVDSSEPTGIAEGKKVTIDSLE